jgi:hypothetical protein
MCWHPKFRLTFREGTDLTRQVDADLHVLVNLGPSKVMPQPDGIELVAMLEQRTVHSQ